MALANGSGKRAFKTDLVLLNGFNSLLGDRETTIRTTNWGNIDLLPFDRDLSGSKDLHDGLRDLRSDTVTGDECDSSGRFITD